MIQAANRPRVYWVHFLWIITLFIELMLYWWVLHRWHTAQVWTFFLFLWVTFSGILVYLSSVILFPGELENTGSPDWRDYYYKNQRGHNSSFQKLGLSPPVFSARVDSKKSPLALKLAAHVRPSERTPAPSLAGADGA